MLKQHNPLFPHVNETEEGRKPEPPCQYKSSAFFRPLHYWMLKPTSSAVTDWILVLTLHCMCCHDWRDSHGATVLPDSYREWLLVFCHQRGHDGASVGSDRRGHSPEQLPSGDRMSESIRPVSPTFQRTQVMALAFLTLPHRVDARISSSGRAKSNYHLCQSSTKHLPDSVTAHTLR